MSDDPTDQLSTIARLAERSPGLGLLAIVLVPGVAGTLASVFVSPHIDTALQQHAEDPHAHAVEFAAGSERERRLDRIEEQLQQQGTDLAEIRASMALVLDELRRDGGR